VLGEELKKKKKKKKKKKSSSKPRFALDVARNPKPYEIPLYYPPFPSVINHQPKVAKEVFRVENLLRNYMGVNNRELKRLGNNMTAYRQEAQTAFKQNIAYPKASAIPAIPPPDAPEIPTTEDIISGTDIEPEDITSAGEETLMKKAGEGAERLTEPEGMTTDIEVKIPKRKKRKKKVRISPETDDPETDRPPVGRQRRPQKNMTELKAELRAAGIKIPAGIKQLALHNLAVDEGISLDR
jgi:hypothetical protein